MLETGGTPGPAVPCMLKKTLSALSTLSQPELLSVLGVRESGGGVGREEREEGEGEGGEGEEEGKTEKREGRGWTES